MIDKFYPNSDLTCSVDLVCRRIKPTVLGTLTLAWMSGELVHLTISTSSFNVAASTNTIHEWRADSRRTSFAELKSVGYIVSDDLPSFECKRCGYRRRRQLRDFGAAFEVATQAGLVDPSGWGQQLTFDVLDMLWERFIPTDHC